MKTKKLIALLTAVLCLCTVLAACGTKPAPSTASDAAEGFATLGEAMAAAEEHQSQSSTYHSAYVMAFELNGDYWRVAAELNDEQAAALDALDMLDDDYDAKLKELLSPIAVTKCEKLNDLKLTEDEMNALVGKTGEDLLKDGWTSGYGYNLEDKEFYLEKSPFTYFVTFSFEEKLEDSDDFDVEEAIRPMTVKSVAFEGLGDGATEMPEYMEAEDEPSVDYLVLVNKQNKLPEDWEATVELEDAQNTIPEGVELNEDNDYLATDVFRVEKKALEAFRALQADLEAEGIIILLDSTYRSVARQEELWSEFEEEYGLEYTQNTVAVPGTSEHHTGLAIDVCIVKDGVVINENDDMIAEREIFAKIHAKLADYGFILRFPEGGKEITGYDYEPWHFRYVGVEAAREIAAQGVTLEEYLGAVPEAEE